MKDIWNKIPRPVKIGAVALIVLAVLITVIYNGDSSLISGTLNQ